MDFKEFMMSLKEGLEKDLQEDLQGKIHPNDLVMMKMISEIELRPWGATPQLTTAVNAKVAPFMKNLTQAAAEANQHLERAMKKDFELLIENHQGPCKCLKCAFKKALEDSEKTEPVINKL